MKVTKIQPRAIVPPATYDITGLTWGEVLAIRVALLAAAEDSGRDDNRTTGRSAMRRLHDDITLSV